MIEVKPQENGYDSRRFLSLKGIGELGAGENLKLSMGETIVCGRSRHCDWSLKRAPAYLGGSPQRRDGIRKSLAFRSVSRQHVRISYLAPDMVELTNLSSNGTIVDGNKVDRIILKNCDAETHVIKLGPKGVELELQPGSLPV